MAYKARGLQPKQKLFVAAYLVSLNAATAAREAGYRYPGVQGARLLSNVRVQDAIAKGVSLKEARFQIKADDILVELGKLAMVNMMDYTRVDEDENLVVDFSTLTREQAACIASIENKTFIKGEGAKETEVKFKLTDKRAALVDLGRHFGLFLDRTESNVTHTVTDEPAITDEEWMEDHGAEDER